MPSSIDKMYLGVYILSDAARKSRKLCNFTFLCFHRINAIMFGSWIKHILSIWITRSFLLFRIEMNTKNFHFPILFSVAVCFIHYTCEIYFSIELLMFGRKIMVYAKCIWMERMNFWDLLIDEAYFDKCAILKRFF